MRKELEDEIWRSIPTYPKYEVSSLGHVRNVKRRQFLLKPTPNWRGYLRVDLRSTDRKTGRVECVHRLVAYAFLPNPNNYPQINHISGIKEDNSVTNLEWCTNIHNRRHAQKLGLFGDLAGDNSPARKLDSLQVKTIRKIIEEGISYSQLAKYFKVGKSAIKDINLKRTWSTLL